MDENIKYYRILFGIPAAVERTYVNDDGFIVDQSVPYDYDVWCDFALCQDVSTDKYWFEFESFLGFASPSGAKNWLRYCLIKLTEYMNLHNYDTNYELNLYEVCTEGYGATDKFDSIEKAYAFMKFLVEGFNGTGIQI